MRNVLPFLAGLAACVMTASAQTVLWSNELRGPGTPDDFGLNPRTTANAGQPVSPPVLFWSECQTDGEFPPPPPEQWYASNVAGHGIQLEGTTSNAAADDFIVTGTWQIDAFEFAAYETSAPFTASSIVRVVVQVWNGRPGDPGSTVVWGDLTTNRLAGPPAPTGVFRIFSTTLNACGVSPGSAVGTGRAIYRVRANTPGLTLSAGTYWVEWQMEGSASFAGPWAVPVTRQYNRDGCAPFGQPCNSRQRITATWQDMVDNGQPRGPSHPAGASCSTYTGPDPTPRRADMCFLVYGTASGGCPGTGAGACSRADWNEDGVIDFNDFLAFLNDFNTEDPCADLNSDGVVDFNDFLEFLNIYNVGC
jgi:hypothetical protein